MTPKYIDIHGHVNFSDYDKDRDQVIKRAQELNVSMITVGTDHASSKSALQLAKVHENMWATVGIHPTDTKDEVNAFEGASGGIDKLRELATDPKVLAIGECGLDYFHSKPEEIGAQRTAFEKQIHIANEVNKSLMLHVRNGKSDGSAYQEAIQILKAHAKVRANFHFFAGTIQDLKDILDMDCTVSFTGVLTFTKDYDEVVKYVPLDHVMSETDCPFATPAPHRGKRNEPAYVIEVVKAIARIRGEDERIIAEHLLKNAEKMFGIK